MYKTISAGVLGVLLLTGCATPINNKTVLENKESLLMFCKSDVSFILTEQIQLPSKEAVIVKSIPITKNEDCSLILSYDLEILLTNIRNNNGNKDSSRVSVYDVELISGNLMDDERTGYTVTLTPNTINYIGHIDVRNINGKSPKVSFINNIDGAKQYLKTRGITKFSVITSLPKDNI
jgi:hypothetical protein